MANKFELFRMPEKLYFKKGSLPVALRELKEVYHIKNVLLLVSDLRYQENAVQQITDRLHEMQIDYTVSELNAAVISAPECVLAYGDSVLETAAKMVNALPEKPYYITVPSHLGTVAHVFPLPDGRFPDMTIVDTDIMQKNPEVIKMSLTRALDALVAETATEFSDGMAVRAVQMLLNMPDCSPEQLAESGTLAGCAFCNAHAQQNQWSGQETVCAEKLGMKTELFLEKLKAIAFNF